MQIEKDYIDRLIELEEEFHKLGQLTGYKSPQFWSKLNYLLGYITALKVVSRVKVKEACQ